MIAFLIIAVLYQILLWILGIGFGLHWFTIGWIVGDMWRAWDRGMDPDSLLAYLIKCYKWVVSYIKRIKLR